ncbi:MAG: heme o synthase [Albidovulum sp.]|nr:heme o synthase [Albidovulum sp.]
MSNAEFIDRGKESTIRDSFALFKPRVMSLAVFTAAAGMLVAPTQLHPLIGFSSILFIAVGAGASGALNMWWDADIDAKMRRTRHRPIPSGKIDREDALTVGVLLSGIAVIMLGLTANIVAAALLALTILYYVVFYTMYLKRLTPHNIVIGGAAGAFPPMIGWAAATGGITSESILMFLVIFLWTPPHFWSLALFVSDDYSKAGVPMMTVAKGPRATRRQIFAYAALLVPVSAALAFSGIGGPVTFALAIVLNAEFLRMASRVAHRSEADSRRDRFAAERKFFFRSIAYLFLLFSGLIGDAALRWSLGGALAWPQWV